MTEREPSSGRPRCTGCGAFLRRGHATTGMCDPCLSKHSATEEADAAARECGWQPDKQLKTYSGEDHTVSVLRLLPRPTAHCAPKTGSPIERRLHGFSEDTYRKCWRGDAGIRTKPRVKWEYTETR